MSIPHNLEAEQALLGAVLYDNAAFERLPDRFTADAFHEPFHGRVFAAVEALIRQGRLAEPIAVMERVRHDPAFADLGGLAYFAALVDAAPPAAAAPDMARIVADLATRRALMRLCGETAEAARADTAATGLELIEQAEQGLYALAERGGQAAGVTAFADAVAGAVEQASAACSRGGGVSGLATGLIDLDHKLGGLHRSDLVVLAARPSMGKTALAMGIAFHAARAGGAVLVFSLEMSAEQLAMRLLAGAAATPSDRIRRGDIGADDYARIRDAAVEIAGAPLYIDATGGLPIAKLAARARRQKRLTGLDLIVVDYLQLVTAPRRGGDNRVQEVSEISMALKALAKDLDVPVLALSQLSRQVESRDDKRPQLSDLRDSGSIEQDADVVMFLYREAYYLGRVEPEMGSPEHLVWQDRMNASRHVAELIVGKQRHGPIGTLRLHFDEALTRFSSLAREPRDVRRPYADD